MNYKNNINNIDNTIKTIDYNFEHIKNKVKFISLVSIFFIITIFLIYYIIKFGILNGLLKLFISWIFFTIATPTPQTGLLLSLPLKIIYKIPLDISQFIASIVSLIIIFGLHFYSPETLKSEMFGKVLDSVVKNNAYLILVTSTIGSTTLSGLIDNCIDYFSKKNINYYKVISYLILTIISFVYYNLEMEKYNLYKIFNS